MMIRNANRNISVAKGHGYEIEKVKYAVNFVEKAGRNTTIDEWVAAYNYIKNANETAQGCQSCKAAKFTAAVRNYARYGYLTLLNEGHSPEEFKDNVEPASEKGRDTGRASVEVASETASAADEETEESQESQVETTENSCDEEKQPETVAEQKPKVRRKKNVKSDDKQ